MEVPLAHNLACLEIDQKGGALAHHAVEGAQVPDIQPPALVPALAWWGPFGGFQIAQPGRPRARLAGNFLKVVRGPHDLFSLARQCRLDLAPPFADEVEGFEVAPDRPVGLVHFVGGQATKVGDVKLGEDRLGGDLFFAFAEAFLRHPLTLAGVVGVQAHDDVL